MVSAGVTPRQHTTLGWRDRLPYADAEKLRERSRRRYADPAERQKDRIRRLARRAIEKGMISRGCCVICGQHGADAHHPDYCRPALVIWLCPLHHQQHHYALRRADETAVRLEREGCVEISIPSYCLEILIQKTKWTPERKALFASLLAANTSAREIATTLGIKPKSVYSYRKRFGL